MGYRELLNRAGELERVLRAPEIETALNFTRLHYQSHGKEAEAKNCDDLLTLIKKMTGE